MARKARRISTEETALTLADKAEQGDEIAAYDLAVLVRAGSVTELLEFVAPDDPASCFDAIADGFALFLQRKAGK